MPNRVQEFFSHLSAEQSGVGVDPLIHATDDIPKLKGFQLTIDRFHILTAICLHNRKRVAKTRIPFGIGYDLWLSLGNALRRVAVPWRAVEQRHDLKAAAIECAMRPFVPGVVLITEPATGDAVWVMPFTDNGPPIALRFTADDCNRLMGLWLENRGKPGDDAVVH